VYKTLAKFPSHNLLKNFPSIPRSFFPLISYSASTSSRLSRGEIFESNNKITYLSAPEKKEQERKREKSLSKTEKKMWTYKSHPTFRATHDMKMIRKMDASFSTLFLCSHFFFEWLPCIFSFFFPRNKLFMV
jgi:hypothetical protein